MLYACRNYKTKKELVADVKAGKKVQVYDPGAAIRAGADISSGKHAIGGPHFPAPHKWYGEITVKDGIILTIK